MERFIINGGRQLKGKIKVKGAKNAALKILAASLLTDQEWIVSNVPCIEDISRLLELLKEVGVNVSFDPKEDSTYYLRAEGKIKSFLNPEIADRLKGSILMAAPLLARCGEVNLPQSGGCVIGQRPRDIFLEGFQAFGAEAKKTKNGFRLTAAKIKGTKFVFPVVSVTATETMMLMAVLAKGKSLLVNAACEPEVVALADFLNHCGAKIKGAGTSFIEIEGVSYLGGGQCRIIPDRLEAGSFALLGAASQSQLVVEGIEPSHLDVLWAMLDRAQVNFSLGKDNVVIKPPFKLKAVNLKTHEYPGFPTDLQAPFTVLMTQAEGLSLIHETIFEGRLFYVDCLNQMGAKAIMCDPHRALIKGPAQLFGRRLISPDIRAGIALVIASLVAQGDSVIENIYQIDRGYEKIEERLQKIGAEIKRVAV